MEKSGRCFAVLNDFAIAEGPGRTARAFPPFRGGIVGRLIRRVLQPGRRDRALYSKTRLSCNQRIKSMGVESTQNNTITK